MRLRTIAILCICFLAVNAANAQLHGRDFSGVVMFDRWDSCYLISGTYVTYVSKSSKEALRPYNGMAIHVYAYDEARAANPGDISIREYKIIGPVPDTHRYAVLDGLELLAEPDFGPGREPGFFVEVRNAGVDTRTIMSYVLGPLLLGPSPVPPFGPPERDVSSAIVAHGTFLDSWRWQSWDGISGARSAAYTVDPEGRPPERFQLAPGESMKVHISLTIPAGQYQFLVGYGGGFNDEKSLVSNVVSFDVSSSGVVTMVK